MRHGEAQPPADSALVDFFKQWRRGVAQRTQVPAYVVLSDAALEDLCRKQPTNLRELLSVSGIGERKAELYGSDIFAAFDEFHKARAPQPRKPRRSLPPMRPFGCWPRERPSSRSRNCADANPRP